MPKLVISLRAALTLSLCTALWAEVSLAATTTRTTAFTYDSNGQLKKEVVEPGISNLCLVVVYSYDEFGNTTGETTRNCNGSPLSSGNEASAPVGDATFLPRSTSTSFDAIGRYPSGQTNALGHTATVAYEVRYGSPISSTDVNGLSTSVEYDAWGRKSLEIRPDGTRTSWSYEFCSGFNGGTASCPFSGRYVVTVQPQSSTGAANGPWVKSYYDQLERLLRTDTVGFDGTTVIRADRNHDALGRVWRTSRPYFVGSTIQWAYTTFDALGRPFVTTYPDGQTMTMGYNGVETTVTNALSQTESKTVNSQGWLTATKDAAGKILNYEYDPVGNLLKTIDPLGNVVQMQYDTRGRKIGMTDPDMGTWTYVYNAIGQLLRQTDAKSQISSLQYDLLGRMTARTEPDLSSNWYYDAYKGGGTCSNGIGQLCESESSNGYRRVQSYDSLSRPASAATTIDGSSYSTSLTYDALGRGVETQTSPGGFSTKNIYTALGHLKEVRNGGNNSLYWSATTVDAEGRATVQSYGSGTSTQYGYDPRNGRIEFIRAGLTNRILNWSYTYDAAGNLSSRSDGNAGYVEGFEYDVLNRLKKATLASSTLGTTVRNYSYDEIGNLTSRDGVGTYSYNSSGASSVKPHAVQSVALFAGGTLQYQYDANGNLHQRSELDSGGTPIASRAVTTSYSSYNLPTSFVRTGDAVVPPVSQSFTYGPERQRIKQQEGNVTTIYLHPDNVGNMQYEKRTTPSSTLNIYYISAGGMPVAQVSRTDAGVVVSTQYFHRDALGSTVAITNASAVVVERAGYEPFGTRRQPDGQEAAGLSGTYSHRGFTNHEHLEDLGLIHMNGRVYDAAIGRFMSADAIIPYGTDIAAYNRYSYVINNPLIYSDPSGHIFGIGRAFKSVERSVRHEAKRFERDFRHEIRRPDSLLGPALRVAGSAASLLCTAGTPGCVAAVVAATEAGVGRAQGVTGSALLRSVTIATGTALAFRHVGLNASNDITRYAGHAAVGCLSASAGGGNCASGAAAAFVGKWTTIQTKDIMNGALRFAAASASAGLTSEITGGSFANGAVTGAFGYLFNQMISQLALGQDAHRPLQKYARELDPENVFTDRFSDGEGTIFFGRPDIGHRGLFQIWEIKSEQTGISQGAAQLLVYALASSLTGQTYSPGGSDFLFSGGQTLTLAGRYAVYTYTMPAPGIVLYSYRLNPGVIMVPIGAAARALPATRAASGAAAAICAMAC